MADGATVSGLGMVRARRRSAQPKPGATFQSRQIRRVELRPVAVGPRLKGG